jgi:hypothetical protein
MLHFLIWGLVAGLLALWSLAAWALHASLQWAATQAGTLAQGGALPQTISLPPALQAWIPAEWQSAAQALLQTWAPSLDTLVSWLPSVSGGLATGLAVVVGVTWMLGLAALLLLGGLGSGLVAWLGRRPSTKPSEHRPALSA